MTREELYDAKMAIDRDLRDLYIAVGLSEDEFQQREHDLTTRRMKLDDELHKLDRPFDWRDARRVLPTIDDCEEEDCMVLVYAIWDRFELRHWSDMADVWMWRRLDKPDVNVLDEDEERQKQLFSPE